MKTFYYERKKAMQNNQFLYSLFILYSLFSALLLTLLFVLILHSNNLFFLKTFLFKKNNKTRRQE